MPFSSSRSRFFAIGGQQSLPPRDCPSATAHGPDVSAISTTNNSCFSHARGRALERRDLTRCRSTHVTPTRLHYMSGHYTFCVHTGLCSVPSHRSRCLPSPSAIPSLLWRGLTPAPSSVREPLVALPVAASICTYYFKLLGWYMYLHRGLLCPVNSRLISSPGH